MLIMSKARFGTELEMKLKVNFKKILKREVKVGTSNGCFHEIRRCKFQIIDRNNQNMIVSLDIASNSIHAHDIDPDAPFFSRLPGKRPGQRFQLLSLRLPL